MIKYINIYFTEYEKISNDKGKENPYCVEFPNKGKIYKVNRLYHREDGPAIMYNDGTFDWYLNGNYYSFKEWCKKLNKSDEEKIFLKLKYL